MSNPTGADLVAIVCEHPGVVLGTEYAPGTGLALSRAEAERHLRVWTQVASDVVYYFRRVEDHEAVKRLQEDQRTDALPPIPGVEALAEMAYDKVVALAKAHGVVSKNVSKRDLVAALRAIANKAQAAA